ncbi:DUF6478 family protein [Oceaniglobus ichthyenteri]|uniref:DUF6478 family protein n=1 Tax=Oceaniglobus ichthyenteri TaxID=2136177 RepID=UPI000D388BFB|nr:DUF6478 family protein [Oceaniglobus ichthyenteri]
MANRLAQKLGHMLDRRILRRWSRLGNQAAALSLGDLRLLRDKAAALRRRLDRILHAADGRLALPHIGSTAIQKPLGCDWAYRPEPWRGPLPKPGAVAVESRTQIGREATIFHDCQVSELTYRQVRNLREADLAPFGLRLDVFRFDGSFLSLVIDLPQSSVEGLEKRHIVRLDTIVEIEKPLEIFARLNVRHGPNTEQIVRELPLAGDELSVEFDLAYTRLNEKRADKMWIDLIFEGPQMNQITLRDVTLTRRPRAEL